MFRAPLSENASVQVLYRFSALLLSFEIACVWPNAIPDTEIFKKTDKQRTWKIIETVIVLR